MEVMDTLLEKSVTVADLIWFGTEKFLKTYLTVEDPSFFYQFPLMKKLELILKKNEIILFNLRNQSFYKNIIFYY